MASDSGLLRDASEIVEQRMTTRLVPDNSTYEDGLNALATAIGQATGLILRLAREVDRLSLELQTLTNATGHNPRA